SAAQWSTQTSPSTPVGTNRDAQQRKSGHLHQECQQSMCPSQKRATSPTSEYFKASLTRHLHAAKLSAFGAARSRTPTGSSLPCPQRKMGETPFSGHACSAQPLRTDWEFLC